jgi:hypothetical protein
VRKISSSNKTKTAPATMLSVTVGGGIGGVKVYGGSAHQVERVAEMLCLFKRNYNNYSLQMGLWMTTYLR